MKKELEQRKEQQARKPGFSRHASHRKARLPDNWRRPKGLQNKLRLNKKSRGPSVSTGYRTPVLVRGRSESGKKEALVYTKNDILNLEPESHALIIARVGNKRRVELLEEAKKQGFEVLNHDVEKRVTEIKKEVETRGSKSAARAKKREALEKAKETKGKKAEKAEVSKEEQKKAQDKVLTKGEQQ